ncbi:hypothetical protein C8C87_0284 [Flavobacterium sp. 120]|nr:hypothetical protein C8C87_0284 [Flavobacterium sp. 120]
MRRMKNISMIIRTRHSLENKTKKHPFYGMFFLTIDQRDDLLLKEYLIT